MREQSVEALAPFLIFLSDLQDAVIRSALGLGGCKLEHDLSFIVDFSVNESKPLVGAVESDSCGLGLLLLHRPFPYKMKLSDNGEFLPWGQFFCLDCTVPIKRRLELGQTVRVI